MLNPCPNCGHGLRAVHSMAIALCDQCGYNEPLPPELASPPLAPKETPKKDNDHTDRAILIILLIITPFILSTCGRILGVLSSDTRPAPKAAQVTAPARPARQYIGKIGDNFDYTLWKEGNCVIAAGLTERDLRRLGVDVWGFKDVVKKASGIQCVLLE